MLNTCVVRQQAEDKGIGKLRAVAYLKKRGHSLSVVGSEAAFGRGWNDGFFAGPTGVRDPKGGGTYDARIGRDPFRARASQAVEVRIEPSQYGYVAEMTLYKDGVQRGERVLASTGSDLFSRCLSGRRMGKIFSGSAPTAWAFRISQQISVSLKCWFSVSSSSFSPTVLDTSWVDHVLSADHPSGQHPRRKEGRTPVRFPPERCNSGWVR